MQNFSKLKTTLIAALCVTMTCGTISAQDTDLSAQRNEALQFLPVNGEKIDHNGIIVNPTPHEITLRQNNGALDVSAGISIDDKKHKFAGDVAFAGQFGDGPVKLTIVNWEPGKVEWFDAPLNPAAPDGPSRKVPFTGEVYIERTDFMEEPPKKYFRLRPDGEVRLKYTYIVKCQEVIKDADGNITEIRCTYDPSSRPGAGEWRSVKGTIHWVSAAHAREIELRIYDKLFTEPQMNSIPEGKDYKDYLNPDSLVVTKGFAEPALLEDRSGIAVQFERTGYFYKDPDSTPEHFVFNKTTSLKDSFKF